MKMVMREALIIKIHMHLPVNDYESSAHNQNTYAFALKWL
jgi:hypothetical protein